VQIREENIVDSAVSGKTSEWRQVLLFLRASRRQNTWVFEDSEGSNVLQIREVEDIHCLFEESRLTWNGCQPHLLKCNPI
jgi:hypothetical protein